MSRVRCLVAECGRSVEAAKIAPHDQWICSKHWARVPRGLKRAKARHERERRKYGFYPRDAAYRRVWAACGRHAGAFSG